jgi:hypothetical protein
MQAVARTAKAVAAAVLNRIVLSHSMVDPAMREDVAMQTSIVPGQADAGEDYLARVQRIAATIEAEAEASERSLRLTPTLQAALHRQACSVCCRRAPSGVSRPTRRPSSR